MAYSVTSSFIAESRGSAPNVVRSFTFGGSDYTDHVMQWPRISRRWDEIQPKTITIKLANGDQAFNFIQADKTKLEGQAVLSMGFDAETIELFAGTVRKVAYNNEICSLTIVDKFQQLSERIVGKSDDPVSYTSSNYLPSDLAWYAVTSYGGYSNVKSTSNVDIDYAAFETWAAVFSGDSVLMQARWTGQKVTEILKKISRQTHSAIFIKESKLTFHRFSLADTNISSLGPDQIHNMQLSFATDDITNRQYVALLYSVTSDYHTATIVAAVTPSVNSFGLKENLIKDDTLWYVDSASAINLAERLLLSNAAPDDHINITAGLVGLPRLIGETITVGDAFHSINQSYRILEHSIDMDKGITQFGIDRTQLFGGFILNTSSLDSTADVLS